MLTRIHPPPRRRRFTSCPQHVKRFILMWSLYSPPNNTFIYYFLKKRWRRIVFWFLTHALSGTRALLWQCILGNNKRLDEYMNSRHASCVDAAAARGLMVACRRPSLLMRVVLLFFVSLLLFFPTWSFLQRAGLLTVNGIIDIFFPSCILSDLHWWVSWVVLMVIKLKVQNIHPD